MCHCWAATPGERPEISEVCDKVEGYLRGETDDIYTYGDIEFDEGNMDNVYDDTV